MTDTLPNNLHNPVTRLVGRRAELSELAALMTTQRLVTVAGPGGCGKTRLAAELAGRIVRAPVDPPAGADELRWVDLAPFADGAEAVLACAKALGVRLEAESQDPAAALVSALRHRRAVVVLDTCEHLLGAAADLIERLVTGCPGVAVLATSREPLGIPGEAVWRVPALAPADAAELFVDRARLADHGVDLSPLDPTVAAICSRLDGLPLAIELAAAWVRVFAPAQILASLDERFRLLTGGLRRGAPRHRTLEASMAWSHALLDAEEQRVFRRLAVFVGGFDLDAAEAVCAATPEERDETVETLARLVDKSLLVADHDDDRARYRMLDTVREYASDKLEESGELTEARERHLAWCLDMLRRVDAALRRDQDEAMRLFDSVDADATAALDGALGPDPQRRGQARQLAHLMVMPWFLRSQSRRGRPLLDRAIASPTDPDDGLGPLLASDLALLGIVAGRRRAASQIPEVIGDRAEHRLARARFELVDAFEAFFVDHDACERHGLAASEQGKRAGDPFTEDFGRIVAAYSLTARERHDDAQRIAATDAGLRRAALNSAVAAGGRGRELNPLADARPRPGGGG